MSDPLSRARQAAAVIAPLAAAIEAARRLPEEAVRALTAAGVFKLVVPHAYGGEEASARTTLAVIEEIARADGSAGWCAMIGSTSALMCGYVDDAVAREVYGPEGAITCGVFAPMGRGVKASGGYRVSGRWAFASGCEHSAWRMGGAMVEGEAAPRSMLFRAEETRVIDTWDTSGLRGTGSHDFEVSDVFVPAARSFSLVAEPPRLTGGVYALPFFGVLALGVAHVVAGIARAAVDQAIAIAKTKHPLGAKRGLAHRETVQYDLARAEAKVRAARALLSDALAEVEREVDVEGKVSLEARARVRLSACHAAQEAQDAVDIAYETGGASGVYAKNPLQRHFRDAHTATQHLMLSKASATLAGRVLLGVEADTSTL